MVWESYCTVKVAGNPINSGHYLAEENPNEVIKSIKNFMHLK